MIKRGLQYINYFNENEVIKKRQNLLGIILKLIFWYPKLLLNPNKLYTTANEELEYTENQFNELKANRNLHIFFAIIEFNDDHIVQENLITLRDFLKIHTLDENKKIILHYFEFVKELWENGLFETTFNFTINYGLSSSNEIKLIDVGEFCFEKEKLIKYIRNKEWLRQWSYNSLKDIELKKYFRDNANKFFTVKNMNKYWNRKLLSSSSLSTK